MKNLSLISSLLGLICFGVNAQSYFQRTYGGDAGGLSLGSEAGYGVQQTADGGYVIAGHTSFGVGNGDFYLIRTDAAGDTLWTKAYGDSTIELAKAVLETSDGGFVLAGHSTDPSGLTADDISVVRTDSLGNLVWSKKYGGSLQDQCRDIKQTSDGGFILVGFTQSFGPGTSAVYVIKTDANGDIVWTRTFGGSGYEEGNSVALTNDGGYIISGWTSTFGPGLLAIFIVKIDANGNLVWTKTLGGNGTENGNSILQTSDSGYMIAGITSSFGAGGDDVYLIKTDSLGNPIWSKTYGTTKDEGCHFLQQTNDGGFVIVGKTHTNFNPSVYLIRTDSIGDTLWTRTYGDSGYDYGYCIQETSDGGFIVSGETNDFGVKYFDVYLIKLDASGNGGCNQLYVATTVNSINTLTGSGGMTGSGGVSANRSILVSNTQTEDSILCAFFTSTQPQDYLVQEYWPHIYPNPARQYATIDFESPLLEKIDIFIFNYTGQVIRSFRNLQLDHVNLSLAQMKPGLYMIQIKYADESTQHLKLIVN